MVVQVELTRGERWSAKSSGEWADHNVLGDVPVHKDFSRSGTSDDRVGDPRICASYPENLRGRSASTLLTNRRTTDMGTLAFGGLLEEIGF
jgi:hypothetical protein